MKKYKKVIPLLIALCIVLTSCGEGAGNKKNTSEQSDTKATALEQAEARKYNSNMSLDEYTQATNDMVELVTDLGNVFSNMSELCVKYADEINTGETFDWSQYWDYREIKEEAISICDTILEYDDSKCSQEYQICIDELKSVAFETKVFFTEVSKEMDINELDARTQILANDFNIGMSNASVYQIMATIAYMEANDGDPEKVSALRQQIADNYTYKVLTGESSTTSKDSSTFVFTNSYGNVDTKCAHTGCTNAIASSGDTNCCVMHSNKCLNCGKYIDEDAMFCMDCLSGKTTSIEDTGKYSSVSSVPKGGCTYVYFDGSYCGKSTNKYASLCDQHFKELNDTYQSLIGK